jgi:hypothetical protein
VRPPAIVELAAFWQPAGPKIALQECNFLETSMLNLLTPMLADYIWIGGGTLGLILVILLVVLVLRK